jgi:SAM-dependent methyltransferase
VGLGSNIQAFEFVRRHGTLFALAKNRRGIPCIQARSAAILAESLRSSRPSPLFPMPGGCTKTLIAASVEYFMHKSAYELGGLFLDHYRKPGRRRILDVGSMDVNGSLRDHAQAHDEYIGVDMTPGPGVDIVLDDPYVMPFPDGHADAVVATSVFEHAQFFWVLFVELVRVCKDDGFIYLNVPSNGMFHQYPQDFWRFYPDAGLALVAWAKACGHAVSLVESGIAAKQNRIWNDFIAVFQKAPVVHHQGPLLVDDQHRFSNIRRHDSPSIVNFSEHTEDYKTIESLRRRSLKEHALYKYVKKRISGLSGSRSSRKVTRI